MQSLQTLIGKKRQFKKTKMGITDFSVSLIYKVVGEHKNIKNVVELGDQNLYIAGERYGKYANILYEEMGLDYTCIDLNGGNNAIVWDMSKPQKIEKQFDLLTDFGFSEHVSDGTGKHSIEAFYNCWKTKHDLLKPGGIMINENPKTGNWIGHGQNYMHFGFYHKLVELQGYELLVLDENAAMGNITDGWNISCVIKKVDDRPFMSLEQFQKCDVKTK